MKACTCVLKLKSLIRLQGCARSIWNSITRTLSEKLRFLNHTNVFCWIRSPVTHPSSHGQTRWKRHGALLTQSFGPGRIQPAKSLSHSMSLVHGVHPRRMNCSQKRVASGLAGMEGKSKHQPGAWRRADVLRSD